MFKRISSLVLALLMVLTVSATAFAAEAPEAPETPEVETIVIRINADGTVVAPQDVSNLYSFQGKVPMDVGRYFKVTPAKGTNLKIIAGCVSSYGGVSMSPLKVTVTKNGGWWPSKTLTIPADGSTNTYTLIENCNGEPYTINMTTTGDCSYVVLQVVSTEYT